MVVGVARSGAVAVTFAVVVVVALTFLVPGGGGDGGLRWW